jgi:hypothetical protein
MARLQRQYPSSRCNQYHKTRKLTSDQNENLVVQKNPKAYAAPTSDDGEKAETETRIKLLFAAGTRNDEVLYLKGKSVRSSGNSSASTTFESAGEVLWKLFTLELKVLCFLICILSAILPMWFPKDLKNLLLWAILTITMQPGV